MRARTMLRLGGWISGINIVYSVIVWLFWLLASVKIPLSVALVACAAQAIAVVFLVVGFVKDSKLPELESEAEPEPEAQQ